MVLQKTMVTFTIKIPQMLAYIPAPWILWVMDDQPDDLEVAHGYHRLLLDECVSVIYRHVPHRPTSSVVPCFSMFFIHVKSHKSRDTARQHCCLLCQSLQTGCLASLKPLPAHHRRVEGMSILMDNYADIVWYYHSCITSQNSRNRNFAILSYTFMIFDVGRAFITHQSVHTLDLLWTHFGPSAISSSRIFRHFSAESLSLLSSFGPS
jgi:hypothetical protein